MSKEHALERGKELKNGWLSCDEFFAYHFDIDTLSSGSDKKKETIPSDIDVSDFEKLLRAQARGSRELNFEIYRNHSISRMHNVNWQPAR